MNRDDVTRSTPDGRPAALTQNPALGRIGVLIVDDHPSVRLGVGRALEQEGGITVLGEADSVSSGIQLAERLQPEVIVADLIFPNGTGFDLLKDLRIRCPRAQSVVYTSVEEIGYTEHCLRAGATGYVTKSESIAALVQAIRMVHSGGVYLSPARAGQLLSRVAAGERGVTQDPVERLSACEFEVFHLIGRGMSNLEIARVLHRSVKTIETYRSRIKQKIGASNATALAQFAARHLADGAGLTAHSAAPQPAAETRDVSIQSAM